MLYDEGRFDEARDAFVMGHEAVEFMRSEAKREKDRGRLAEDNMAVPLLNVTSGKVSQ